MSSLKNQAYEIIKQRIIDRTYPAHSFIDEKELSSELKASRTPVREALIALSQEGYLQILPKRGVIVLPFTYQDALDAFEVRMLLEPWLVRTYGPTLTKEELLLERKLIIEENKSDMLKNRPGISMRHHPHILLINKCKNRNVLAMLDVVEQQVARVPDVRVMPDTSKLLAAGMAQDGAKVLEDHLRLVDLMLEGKFEEAVKDMEWHVGHAQKQYMNYWFG